MKKAIIDPLAIPYFGTHSKERIKVAIHSTVKRIKIMLWQDE